MSSARRCLEGVIAEKGQVVILVTGATGTVGREAIGVLRGRGAEVAAVTRDPSTAALALGQELTFAEMPPEQVRQRMLAHGLPEEVPDRLLGSLADYALKPGPTTDTVQRLLGRPALSFAERASEYAAAFRN
jgi:NAD(P)-dependent dehydrogenase (short-subunit alcohol dehydrogenase family)